MEEKKLTDEKTLEFAEDINVPNKTELSDEEIIKALECCTELGNCGKCPYRLNKIDCVVDQRYAKDMFAVIHRLLNENTEQKAEIERLTERLDYFQKSSDYHEGNQKELEAKNAELQKQVYAWVRVHDEQLSAMQVLTIENENLQKQVDELTEGKRKLELLSLRLMNDEGHQQAVKDTAKEILCELLDLEVREGDYKMFFLDVCEKLEKFAQKYGVEVE